MGTCKCTCRWLFDHKFMLWSFMNTGPLFPMDIKIHYWGSKNSNLMNMKNVQNDILLCMHRAIS